MNASPINNSTPFKNVELSSLNLDSSHVQGIPFQSTTIPNGIHTAPSNLYKGGKINRKKINKISRKYKMKGSKKTISRHIKRIKSRVRSKYARTHRNKTLRNKSRKNKYLKGGAHAAQAPNYPAGYTQYQNNKMYSHNYSTGGELPAGLSALANPVPFKVLAPGTDNLNHNAVNAYGNSGAGSGFPSRGWF